MTSEQQQKILYMRINVFRNSPPLFFFSFLYNWNYRFVFFLDIFCSVCVWLCVCLTKTTDWVEMTKIRLFAFFPLLYYDKSSRKPYSCWCRCLLWLLMEIANSRIDEKIPVFFLIFHKLLYFCILSIRIFIFLFFGLLIANKETITTWINLKVLWKLRLKNLEIMIQTDCFNFIKSNNSSI